jgi:hypothetical protein
MDEPQESRGGSEGDVQSDHRGSFLNRMDLDELTQAMSLDDHVNAYAAAIRPDA